MQRLGFYSPYQHSVKCRRKKVEVKKRLTNMKEKKMTKKSDRAPALRDPERTKPDIRCKTDVAITQIRKSLIRRRQTDRKQMEEGGGGGGVD